MFKWGKPVVETAGWGIVHFYLSLPVVARMLILVLEIKQAWARGSVEVDVLPALIILFVVPADQASVLLAESLDPELPDFLAEARLVAKL